MIYFLLYKVKISNMSNNSFFLFCFSENKEINHIKQLLGESHPDYLEYFKAQAKVGRCSSTTTAEAALSKCYAKIQTAVSKKHNETKQLLLEKPDNKLAFFNKQLAEKLMKSWNFYFY